MTECFKIIHVGTRRGTRTYQTETSYTVGISEKDQDVIDLLARNNIDIESVMATIETKLTNAGLIAEKPWFFTHRNVYCSSNDLEQIQSIVNEVNQNLNATSFVPDITASYTCGIL